MYTSIYVGSGECGKWCEKRKSRLLRAQKKTKEPKRDYQRKSISEKEGESLVDDGRIKRVITNIHPTKAVAEIKDREKKLPRFWKRRRERSRGDIDFQPHINNSNSNKKGFQDQLLLQQNQPQAEMQQQNSTDSYMGGGGGRSGLMFTEVVSPILPWTVPPVHSFNPIRDHDPFLLPPAPAPAPAPAPSLYGGLFNNRRTPGLQFAYDGLSSDHHLRLISDSLGQVVQSSSAPFGLQAELQKMTAQEIMDAKALAASKSHSEAERRRRERINNHLAKLRSLLPNTTKTDKASLLAEVIQHVKELKRQTSFIAESSPVPTEIDELTVDNASDEDGKFVIRASLCCEDRSDLLPDLIKTLKALRLRTLKAEITTLGGRVKNVLFITAEDDTNNGDDQLQYSISSIQEALKAVMEKVSGDESGSGNVKRQRTNINILERRSL